MIVAIDGFSSCGKSTVAKALAKRLHLPYIDTGAMYRAVTYYFIQNNVDIHDEVQVYTALNNIDIRFKREEENNVLYLNDAPLKEEIRTMEVSGMVSPVSAIPEVRIKMVTLQKQMGEHGAVLDGRDIGTVVFPKADYKFFLVADVDIRAKRRYEELQAKGQEVSYEEIKQNLATRDHIDSTREHSPLRKAEDAIEIDNSNLTKEEQIVVIMQHIKNTL
jgi:CMP/dCMP kinase